MRVTGFKPDPNILGALREAWSAIGGSPAIESVKCRKVPKSGMLHLLVDFEGGERAALTVSQEHIFLCTQPLPCVLAEKLRSLFQERTQ